LGCFDIDGEVILQKRFIVRFFLGISSDEDAREGDGEAVGAV